MRGRVIFLPHILFSARSVAPCFFFFFYKNKCNNNAGLRRALAFRLTKLVKNSNFLIWLWVLFSLLLPSLWILLLFWTLFDLPDGDLAVTTRRATEDVSILGRAESLNAVWMGLQLLCYRVALYVHYQHLATQLTITLTLSITPSTTANPDLVFDTNHTGDPWTSRQGDYFKWMPVIVCVPETQLYWVCTACPQLSPLWYINEAAETTGHAL